MHRLHLPVLSIWVVAFACLCVQKSLASGESKVQWAWIDESCNNRTGELNEAVEEYLEFTRTAHDSLGDGITQVGKATLKTFFGEVDPPGLLIQSESFQPRVVGPS